MNDNMCRTHVAAGLLNNLARKIGKGREKAIFLTSVTSMASKCLSLAVNFAIVPLTISYLGPSQFGLLATITSISSALTFADLGLGNGLVVYIAARGSNDAAGATARAISSVFIAISCVSTILLLCSTALLCFPNLIPAGSKNQLLDTELTRSLYLYVSIFLVALPLTVVEKVQTGLQRGFVSNLWQCATHILTIIGLSAAVRVKATLPVFVLITALAPLVSRALNWLTFFTQHRELRPRLSLIDVSIGKKLILNGVAFAILQVGVIVGYGLDIVIVAAFKGPTEAAAYAVLQRLFSLTLIVELIVAPLWPAMGEAFAMQDVQWIRQTFKRALGIGLMLSIIIVTPITLFSGWLIAMFSKGTVTVDMWFVLMFAIWRVFNVLQGCLSVCLNQEGTMWAQVKFFLAAALLSLALKCYLTPPLGGAGLVAATVIGFLVLYAVPGLILLHRRIGELINEPQ